MIKPQFLAAFVFGECPESLVLLDVFTADNAFLSHILFGPVDVEDLVFGSLYKFLPLFLDPFVFWVVRGFGTGDSSNLGWSPFVFSFRFRIGCFTPSITSSLVSSLFSMNIPDCLG